MIPQPVSDDQSKWLTKLVEQSDGWVLRGDWPAYLRSGDESLLEPLDHLTDDQRTAAAAWLGQQRHALHRGIVGPHVAPDDWLESLPLYAALTAHHRTPSPPDPWSED